MGEKNDLEESGKGKQLRAKIAKRPKIRKLRSENDKIKEIKKSLKNVLKKCLITFPYIIFFI